MLTHALVEKFLKALFCFYIGKPSNHLKTYNGLSDVSLKKYIKPLFSGVSQYVSKIIICTVGCKNIPKMFYFNLCFNQQTEIRKLMRQLERDKIELQGQLRDLEWRLDNESKVS